MTGAVRRCAAACAAVAVASSLVCLPAFSTGAAVEAAAAVAAPEVTGSDDPLGVTIESLRPSTIPATGPLVITGRITNFDDVLWEDIDVYPLTSVEPIRSAEDLAEEAARDPGDYLGDRIIDPEIYAEVPDLAPGETTDFTISIPREDLVMTFEPGVYWLALHVLASEEGVGRVDGVDGRARAFIPLMRDQGRSTSLAVNLQFRGLSARGEEGRLINVRAWQRALRQNGRMTRLLGLGETAGEFPVTWLVDPSVLDAAQSVADGNPPLDLAPAPPADGSGSGGPAPPDEEEDAEDDPEPTRAQAAAEDWLRAFRAGVTGRPLRALPYGDLDVASAFRLGQASLVDEAVRLSAQRLEDLGVTSHRIIAPPEGYFPPESIADLGETPLLLTAAALPGLRETLVRTTDGVRIVRTDPGAAAGGPGPSSPDSALALRQRILADASVHALSNRRFEPLVVNLPVQWDPGARWRRSRFFEGLEVPWIVPTTLSTVVGSLPTGEDLDLATDPVDYPPAQAEEEMPASNLSATQDLISQGEVLGGLLTRADGVPDRVARQAMLGSSALRRARPGFAAVETTAAANRIREELRKVGIRSQSFVTMSSGVGAFQVTLINGLAQTVTVGVRAEVVGAGQLQLTTPPPVEIPPGERRAVLIEAESTDVGVHEVVLRPANADGVPLGDETRLSVRSSNVGLVIWVIMGIGAAFLFSAIGVRLVRRARAHRAGIAADAEGSPDERG